MRAWPETRCSHSPNTPPGRERRCFSMASRRSILVIAPALSPRFAAWPTSSHAVVGRGSPRSASPTSISRRRTTMMKPIACCSSSTRNIRRAAMPSGRRGASAGGRIVKAATPTRFASSSRPRTIFRGPTIVRHGSTGPAARTRRLARRRKAEERYKLELADYRNTYHGHLALKQLAGYTPPPRIILAAAAEANDPAPRIRRASRRTHRRSGIS